MAVNQSTTPEALFQHLIGLVDEASARDMVQFKFPNWKYGREAKPAKVRIIRSDASPFPSSVPDRLIWRRESFQNDNLYPRAAELMRQKEEVLARVVSRDPCVRCGVRHDRHNEHGCKSYKRLGA